MLKLDILHTYLTVLLKISHALISSGVECLTQLSLWPVFLTWRLH